MRNFSWQFYLPTEFLLEICWEEIAEEIFFRISFWCLAWDPNPGFSSNKPTHYLLDLGVFNVANIHLFNFCEQKFIYHGPITIAIDYNGLSLLIFERKWRNYSSGPKSAPNSDSFWVRRLVNVCVQVFCTPAKIKMKRWFFFPKSASSVSRSQAHLAKRCSSVYTTIFVLRKDKTNYLSNQTWW